MKKQIQYGNDIFYLLLLICIIVATKRKSIFNFLLIDCSFIIETIFNQRYSVIFCNIVGHVQIVILIWLLLSKEIVKIVYIEKADSIWEWHNLVIYCYINAIVMLHTESAHASDPLFFMAVFSYCNM